MRRVAAIQLAVAAGVVFALAGSTGVTQAARSGSAPCNPAPLACLDRLRGQVGALQAPLLPARADGRAGPRCARRGRAPRRRAARLLGHVSQAGRRHARQACRPEHDPGGDGAGAGRRRACHRLLDAGDRPERALRRPASGALAAAQRPLPGQCPRPRTGVGGARRPATALHLPGRSHRGCGRGLVARGRAGRNDRSRAVPTGSVAARVRPGPGKRVHALRAAARGPQPDDDRRPEQPRRHRSRLPGRPRRPDGPGCGTLVRGRQARDAGDAAGRRRAVSGLGVVVGLGGLPGQPAPTRPRSRLPASFSGRGTPASATVPRRPAGPSTARSPSRPRAAAGA